MKKENEIVRVDVLYNFVQVPISYPPIMLFVPYKWYEYIYHNIRYLLLSLFCLFLFVVCVASIADPYAVNDIIYMILGD